MRSDGYEGLDASQRALAATPRGQTRHDYVPLNNITSTTSGTPTTSAVATTTAAAAAAVAAADGAGDENGSGNGDARVSQQYVDQFGYLRVFADEPQSTDRTEQLVCNRKGTVLLQLNSTRCSSHCLIAPPIFHLRLIEIIKQTISFVYFG